MPLQSSSSEPRARWRSASVEKRQEFVIGGWSPSTKRKGFASLLLGAAETVIGLTDRLAPHAKHRGLYGHAEAAPAAANDEPEAERPKRRGWWSLG